MVPELITSSTEALGFGNDTMPIGDRFRSKMKSFVKRGRNRRRREDASTRTVIEPPSGWIDLSFRELWQYRELLYFLAWRDVKVRYKQTLLGAAWAIIQPVTAMIIFSIVFGTLAGVPSDDVPYPIFVYAGDAVYERAAATGGMGGVTAEQGGMERTFFGHGYNYRPQELTAALALSQLDRLDEYNAQRREMADYLTDAIMNYRGMGGAIAPAYAEPVHFMYVIEFRPEELDLDIPMEEYKSKVWAALEAEGVPILQWQREIIPAMDFFQDERGYGSTPPWRFGASTVSYDPGDYPRAQQFVASHAYLRGVHPPNGMDLMERYVEAFEKVLTQIDTVLG